MCNQAVISSSASRTEAKSVKYLIWPHETKQGLKGHGVLNGRGFRPVRFLHPIFFTEGSVPIWWPKPPLWAEKVKANKPKKLCEENSENLWLIFLQVYWNIIFTYLIMLCFLGHIHI